MIKIQSDATQFLVQRLCGSNIKAFVTDEETKTITVRLEASTLSIIEEYVEKTGWSRNVVVAFLLQGGIEIVATQLEYEDPQIVLPLGKAAKK